MDVTVAPRILGGEWPREWLGERVAERRAGGPPSPAVAFKSAEPNDTAVESMDLFRPLL